MGVDRDLDDPPHVVVICGNAVRKPPYMGDALAIDISTKAYGLAMKGAELALKEAENYAASAWDAIADYVEKKLYPGTYRHKMRNASYKAAMGALLNKAIASAKGGDYVTAWAIAKTAATLSERPPYKDWMGQISGAVAQLTAEASALVEAYGMKGELQAAKGEGGTFVKAAIPWLPISIGALVLLFLVRGKSGKSGNGNGKS